MVAGVLGLLCVYLKGIVTRQYKLYDKYVRMCISHDMLRDRCVVSRVACFGDPRLGLCNLWGKGH